MKSSASHGYRTWEEVSGYFDGDGALKIHIGIYTVNLQVSWVDQDRELLEHLKSFLALNGITSYLAEVWNEGRKYFDLTVAESGNLIELLRRMFPYVDKKLTQVEAGIDYLENRITADELVFIMNQAVRDGKRSSDIKSTSIPYTKQIGLLISKSRGRWRKRRLTLGQMKAMERDRRELGLSYSELGAKYGVALSTAHMVITRYLREDLVSS